MTENNQDNGSRGVNPVAAAVAGVVIGAGAAAVVVGAMALKDKKNRDKVKEVFKNTSDTVTQYVSDFKKIAQTKKNELDKTVATGKKEVNEIVDSALDSADHVIKTARKINNK